MLAVEKRYMIQELYRQGISISEIARRSGHDRKTIRETVKEPLLRPAEPRVQRVRKIDGYIGYLEKRIQVGVLNARKLYSEIVAQGYTGKESQVRAFVHGHRSTQAAQASVRFETEPGEQGQVDWGHFGLIEHQGRKQHLYGFVMTLGWSRMMYLEFTVSMEANWFLRCHLHAFRYFGGIPHEMLHDNLKTAVLGRDVEGHIHWNPQLFPSEPPRASGLCQVLRFSPQGLSTLPRSNQREGRKRRQICAR